MTLAPREAVVIAPRQRASSALSRSLIFVPSFAVLSILIPGLLIIQVGDVGRSRAWILALLLAAWCGLRLSMLLAAGEARFFAFFVWLFTYIFMGIAPAVQIRSNLPSSTTPDVVATLDSPTMFVVIIGIAAFELATFLAWATRDRKIRPALEWGRGEGAGADVRLPLVMLLTLIGLAVSSYYIAQVGVDTLFTSRNALTQARVRIWVDPAVRAVVISLAVYPLLIGVGGLAQLRRATQLTSARIIYLVLILAGAVVLLVVVNPFSSPRYTLGTVLFALVVLFGAADSRVRSRLSMAGVIFGLFFLFPLADAFRTDQTNFSRSGFFGEYGSNPDYDSAWQVANALAYWNSGEAVPGYQALGIPFFWAPRALWPGKPLDTGALLANYNGYSVTNLSAPLWAESLVNGGIIAVIVVFLLLGYILDRLDGRVVSALSQAKPRVGAIWIIVGAVFPPYFVILMRGSLLQATGAVAVMMASLLAIRRKQRSLRARSQTTTVGDGSNVGLLKFRPDGRHS